MKNNHDRIAVIDIGSNSVRLFIFEVAESEFSQLYAEKFFCGLGKDLGITGNLNPEAVEKTISSLVSFREIVGGYDIREEIVIGTAALREAHDAKDFLDRVRHSSGFNIRIIDGEEEARLAALAILASDREASGIVADFGGGSLELARITAGAIGKKLSLKLGAHYLKALTDGEAGIESVLRNEISANPDILRPKRLYIIGGAWRSLAKA